MHTEDFVGKCNATFETGPNNNDKSKVSAEFSHISNEMIKNDVPQRRKSPAICTAVAVSGFSRFAGWVAWFASSLGEGVLNVPVGHVGRHAAMGGGMVLGFPVRLFCAPSVPVLVWQQHKS